MTYLLPAIPSRAVSAVRAMSAAPSKQRTITVRDPNSLIPLQQNHELNNTASLQRPKTVSNCLSVLIRR